MTPQPIPDWYVCEVPKNELKQLMKREDRRGLLWLAGHFGALIVAGTAAYLTIGTWWMIPAFIAYGSIYTFAASILHETHHGTAFKTRWINEAAHFVAGVMVLKEPIYERWSHTNHHSYTIHPAVDLEIACPRPTPRNPRPWVRMLADFTRLVYIGMAVPKPIMHSFGVFSAKTLKIVPESELPKLRWSSRAMVSFYLLIFASSVYFWTPLPIIYTVGAQVYGGIIFVLIAYTQHAGLEEDSIDHRTNSRTVYLNPLFRFLYWNMNYHIEHHMFPMVPFYNLPLLHRLIKSQLPDTPRGLLSAYRSILPAVIRQQWDPTHFIKVKLPERGAVPAE